MLSQKLLVDVGVDTFAAKTDVLRIWTAAFRSYFAAMD
jgi:hypothetical protein